MSRTVWGEFDGKTVELIEISDGANARAAVLSWGAVLQTLEVPDRDGVTGPVVLGLTSLDDYVNHSPYFGHIAGRYANRICEGRFELDGQHWQLPLNEGPHHLHGGKAGIGKQAWTVNEVTDREVTLSLHRTSADDGYPGNIDVRCIYAFTGPGELTITLKAAVSEACPVNLVNHNYYNLSGEPTIFGHELQVHADEYILTDASAMTVTSVPVAGTPYDFREPSTIISSGQPLAADNDYRLTDRHADHGLREILRLSAPASGRRMIMSSDQPDVQVYAGHKIAVPVPGLNGAAYGAFAGFAIEPQRPPNAINQDWGVDPVLRPDETYEQTLRLNFETF